jgi:predicted DNA-binding transcriptional regulator AlpA
MDKAGERFTLPESGDMLLTDAQVASVYGVSRPTVWRWTRIDPKFPKPVKAAAMTTRWRASVIRAHLRELVKNAEKQREVA